jgi:hypothetical protein
MNTRNSSRDKTVSLSLVLLGVHCPHGTNYGYIYIFIYLMMLGADDVRNYGSEEDIWT